MAEWRLRQSVEIDGEKVAYDIQGDGTPVVLIHGFPGNSYSWRRVAPALARHWRVHVFDMLGFGASAKHEKQSVSGGAQAKLLARLLDHWKLDEPLMVAHDFGVVAALGACLFEGRRYRRLALLDAAVLNPCMSSNSMHVRAHLEAYQTMPARIYGYVLRAHIPTTMYTAMDDETFEGYFAPWRDKTGQAAYFRFIGQFDESYLDRIEAAVPRLTTPTLILWGKEDTWIPLDHGERIVRLIPGSTLHVIPGAGHFIMDDAPEAVAEEIATFLRGDGAAASRAAAGIR
ncbi:MAG: alpha/beta hydrolase [Alphaproteobacteria bacterium]